MSKAVEVAGRAIRRGFGVALVGPSDAAMRKLAAVAIRAFLDAAAEDEEIASGVWTCAYDTWAEFGASDHDGGRAAILSLKNAVEG